MIRTPQAVWLTGDSPEQVEQEARQVTHRAAGKGELPGPRGLQHPLP